VVACSNCGRELPVGADACPACGNPAPTPPSKSEGSFVTVAGRMEPYAIASLVCSIAAFFVPIVIGSVLGIVFGNMARRRIAEEPGLEGASLARAGVIIGWTGLALVGFYLLFILIPLGLARFT
jgi:hypothetical protein